MKSEKEIRERIARLEAFNKRREVNAHWLWRNRHHINGLKWVLGEGEELDEKIYSLPEEESVEQQGGNEK